MAEEIKKQIYSDNSNFSIQCKFNYIDVGQVHEADMSFTISDINKEMVDNMIEPYLNQAIGIITNIFKKNGLHEKKDPLKIYISGGSSRISTLSDLFRDRIGDRYGTYDYANDFYISDSPKACVANGAIHCWDLLYHKMLKIGKQNVTWSRFGMRIPSPSSSYDRFKECIPKGKKLCPLDRKIESKDDDFNEFAIHITEHQFFFNKKGNLRRPIIVFEHFSGEDVMMEENFTIVGRYRMKRPDNIVETEIHGYLRMEINEKYEFTLIPIINGIEYHDIEEI